jgi:hypothetical protein
VGAPASYIVAGGIVVGAVIGGGIVYFRDRFLNESRGKNHLGPNPAADGDHSSFKRNPNGDISNTATYKRNPQNPTGFDEKKRVDVEGKPHYDKKTGKEIPTPHVKEGKDTRPAEQKDLPSKKKPCKKK